MTADSVRHRGKYYGKYSGRVVDSADPNFTGRIKVVVPSVFGEELEVVARPCVPYGHFFIPPSETLIWVEFEAGDPGSPIWVGTWYADDATPAPAQLDPPDTRPRLSLGLATASLPIPSAAR